MRQLEGGSRSARLQREAKLEAKRQEEEMRAIFMRDVDEGTLIARAILGFPLMPEIKVRYRATAKEPPAGMENRMNTHGDSKILAQPAGWTASKWLSKTDIWQEIAKRTKQHLVEAELSAVRTHEELRRVAFSNIGRFFDARGNLKRLDQLAPEDRAAIARIEVVLKNTAAGDGTVERVLKIRLCDKMRALKMAMKHFALLKGRCPAASGLNSCHAPEE